MDEKRRAVLASAMAAASLALGQHLPPESQIPDINDEDKDGKRMPDGKSRDNAIAKQDHEDALKDANQLVTLATQIRDEVDKAGNYVVPVTTLKKLDEMEKLTRKIRSRLKG